MKSLLKQDTNKKLKARDLVILGFLSGLLVEVQVVLAFLPNIELVSFLIIIYTLVYRGQIVFILTAFVLLEGILYGFGTWWLSYLYVWAVLAIITALFRKMDSALFWALISGTFGLFFGALFAIPYLFMGGVKMAVSYWLNGLPFDIVHCVGNFALCLFLYRPIYSLLSRLKRNSL